MTQIRKLLTVLPVLAMLWLCGCSTQTPATEQTVPTVPPPTAAPSEAPTEAPTETPTEMPTEAAEEPAPQWLHSGLREDGSFNGSTLFIGDSLTAGLFSSCMNPDGSAGDAMVMATVGASPIAYFSGPKLEKESDFYHYYSWEFEGKLMSRGVETVGEDLTAVYFMMGTNFLDIVTEQTYINIVTHLLENCPNATIYLQLVPYSLSPKVDEEQINWRIWTAYNHFSVDLQEPRVKIIETQLAIDYNLSADGIHLSDTGYRCWYQALVDNAAANNIPQ